MSRTGTTRPGWKWSIWAAPLAIILVLGAVTWTSTHLLDPYRPLDRLAADRPLAAASSRSRCEVVALDWKWLFIYPRLRRGHGQRAGRAGGPADRFQDHRLSVMNSFYVPALAGQIYAMPGMQTQLHAVINRPGDYEGFSANYSGAGFSGMRFGSTA